MDHDKETFLQIRTREVSDNLDLLRKIVSENLLSSPHENMNYYISYMGSISLMFRSVFAKRNMGSALFFLGICVFTFDVVLRIVFTATFGQDNLLFVGLLVVSVLMMIGGLASNAFFLWSVERSGEIAAKTAIEALANYTRAPVMSEDPTAAVRLAETGKSPR